LNLGGYIFYIYANAKNAQIDSIKLPANFVIERSAKASVEAWIKREKTDKKVGRVKKRNEPCERAKGTEPPQSGRHSS